VRGYGLLQGVEVVKDRETKEPGGELVAKVTARCLENGLHVNIVQGISGGGTLRLAPCLTSTEEELSLGLSILDEALSA
jgi:2,2-dialkylglycine decarboxylase (pyruvate)